MFRKIPTDQKRFHEIYSNYWCLGWELWSVEEAIKHPDNSCEYALIQLLHLIARVVLYDYRRFMMEIYWQNSNHVEKFIFIDRFLLLALAPCVFRLCESRRREMETPKKIFYEAFFDFSLPIPLRVSCSSLVIQCGHEMRCEWESF